MIEAGTITEYDVPVGCLRNEARANKFLASFQSEDEPEDKKAYKLLKDLLNKQKTIWKQWADAHEGHVGNFLDAISGDKYPEEMPKQWQSRLSDIDGKLTNELLCTAYSYAVFVRDDEIVDIIVKILGYIPIV